MSAESGRLGSRSTASDWENVIPVGDVTTATIDVAKDNVQSGPAAGRLPAERWTAAVPTDDANRAG